MKARPIIHHFLSTAIALGLLFSAGEAARAQSAKDAPETITIGSKKFTENVILGAAAAQLLRQAGFAVAYREQLGGSRFLFSALEEGDIDAYPEYTGTLVQELLSGEDVRDTTDVRRALCRRGLRMTAPLGFNNTYALGMNEARAADLSIRTISDLRRHPDLRFGLTNEFMDRADGWPSLRRAYSLPQRAQGMDHDLAYQGLEGGAVDVIDLYSTDAEIDYYNLRVLRDDREHFTEYNAVFLYRADLAERAPEAVRLLKRFENVLSEKEMTRLNKRAKIDRVPEPEVAAAFLNETFDLGEAIAAETASRTERVWERTQEHLFLVGVSLLAAILLAVPLGVAAYKLPRLGQVILSAVGVIYTIPALALLVFMIPLFGIGAVPAMVALFLYSLLPIVRNTHAGLVGIDPAMIESAEALGLSGGARLWQIELPLAARSILAGIKTSAVINIGTATLGALIGAGGYGQPILTGIRLDDVGLILEGAVPAALLALLAQGFFEIAERLVVSKGLRLTAEAR